MANDYGKISTITADRGFANAQAAACLKAKNIYNAGCPKSPSLLAEQAKDARFLKLQTRSSQTKSKDWNFQERVLRQTVTRKNYSK